MRLFLILLPILFSSNLFAGKPIFENSNKSGFTFQIVKGSSPSEYRVARDGQEFMTFNVVGRKSFDELVGFVKNMGVDIPPAKESALRKKLLKGKLSGASDKDLISASMQMLSVAKTSSEDLSCKDDSTPKPAPKKVEKVYCECDVPNEAKEISSGHPFDRLVGGVHKEKFRLDTGNDNLLHGGYQAARKGNATNDGDDRGRTFSIGAHYSATGDSGEFRIDLDSVGFSSLKPSGREGYYKVNKDGAFLVDFLEKNTLDISLRSDSGKDEYNIFGGGFDYYTDEPTISGGIQDAWHKAWESEWKGKKKGIKQYDYQDHKENEVNLFLYAGKGKKWMSDLGKWKCTTVVEATAEAHTMGGQSKIKGRGEFQLDSGSLGGRDKANPWFLVSAWAETMYSVDQSFDQNAGVNLSTKIPVAGWTVEPYVGVEFYNEKEDRMYGEGNQEPYHKLGVVFSRKL